MMEVLRDSNGNAAYPLPEEGIYDENGFLFHHGLPRALLDVDRKRLAQHGIIAESRNYSVQEIELLKHNWEAYRKDHGLSYWSIHKLCGKGVTHSERNLKNSESKQIRNFLQETNFWPRFCAGMEKRSSFQIQRRVPSVFDKYRDVSLKAEERSSCLSFYFSTRSFLEVSSIMKRSLRSVTICIIQTKRKKCFSHSERRWLWMSIKNAYPALFAASDFPMAALIDWKLMETRLLRNADTLAEHWKAMIEELKSKMEAGYTLDEALDIVAPKCERVSPLQVAHFICIVKDKIVNDDDRRIGAAEAIIAPLMRGQGLSGFQSRRFSEFEYMRLMANKIINNCRKRILLPCRILLSMKNLLKLIAEMLRTLPDSDKPIKIRITTEHFFRTLIRMQRAHDSTWTPQNRKLRKFIAKLLPDLS